MTSLITFPFVWNLKWNDTMNFLTKQKQTHRLWEWPYGCLGEEWGEGIVREFGMGIYTLIYFKWITSKDLLYNTQNSAQCFVPPCREVGLRKNGYMCMYAWAPSLFTWNYHSIVNQLYPNIKFKKKEKKTHFHDHMLVQVNVVNFRRGKDSSIGQASDWLWW